MPYTSGSIVFNSGVNVTHHDLWDLFQAFLTGINNVGFSGTVAGTQTGHGELTDARCTAALAQDETITLTCTNDADPNAPVFSVSGSTTGAMSDATGNVPYEQNGIRFRISLERDNDNSGQPDVAYSAGDTFTFDVTQGPLVAAGDAWDILRDYTLISWLSAGERGCLFKGRGSGGTDAIYASVNTGSNFGTDVYYWTQVNGRTLDLENSVRGLNTTQDCSSVNHTFWEGDMDYYFIANGRRFIVAARLGSTGVTTSCYHGFGLPYALPSEYTYPVFLGASASTGAIAHDSSDLEFRAFFDPTRHYCRLNTPGQTWSNVGNCYDNGGVLRRDRYNSNVDNLPAVVEPWFFDMAHVLTTTPADEYYLINGYVATYYGDKVMLEGVYWLPGESPLASFDTITVGGDNYIVVSNHGHVSQGDFACFKLE